jgi:hypothetical protein
MRWQKKWRNLPSLDAQVVAMAMNVSLTPRLEEMVQEHVRPRRVGAAEGQVWRGLMAREINLYF